MYYMYYLKNKIDCEIADILAVSLENAKEIASEYLGGEKSDWVERF